MREIGERLSAELGGWTLRWIKAVSQLGEARQSEKSRCPWSQDPREDPFSDDAYFASVLFRECPSVAARCSLLAARLCGHSGSMTMAMTER